MKKSPCGQHNDLGKLLAGEAQDFLRLLPDARLRTGKQELPFAALHPVAGVRLLCLERAGSTRGVLGLRARKTIRRAR